MAKNSTKLERTEKAVFYWSNDIRFGETNGSVFVWTDNGRVDVVGTIFSYITRDNTNQRLVKRSLLRLSKEPVVAELDGERFWEPTISGLLRDEVIDDVHVDTTRVRRLTQMRRLAESFTANYSDSSGVNHNLRLLDSPIYRYSENANSSAALDGALFVFAMGGTDPEVLLLIEALPKENGPKWHYSIGRFTTTEVSVRRNERIVWEQSMLTSGTNYLTENIYVIDAKLKD